MRDAPWELRFPAMKMLEEKVKVSLKSLSTDRDNEWYTVRSVAFYLSAVFYEMWFLTTIPMVIIQVIFAKFYE